MTAPRNPGGRSCAIDHIATVSGLAPEQVGALGEAVGFKGRSWGALDEYLHAHPEAFTAPGPAEPRTVLLLSHALIEAGSVSVRAPGCAECGQVSRWNIFQRPTGRVCRRCNDAWLPDQPCSRCGRGVKRVEVRNDVDGALCSRCYQADPARFRTCAMCGATGKTVASDDAGQPVCGRCYRTHRRPRRRCHVCGQLGHAQVLLDDGECICGTCYTRPARPCGICGDTKPIQARAANGLPDRCADCYRNPITVCAQCGASRRTAAIIEGRRLCAACYIPPTEPCAVCARPRPVHSRWPLGGVCEACDKRVTSAETPCPRCDITRPLIGADPEHGPVCGPCADPARPRWCTACRADADLLGDGRCTRCHLTERVTAVLGGDDSTATKSYQVLRASLTSTVRPRQILRWLERSGSAKLLRRLAATGAPITHRMLDDEPFTAGAHFLRRLLIDTGALPDRVDRLERLPIWADRLIEQAPPEHRALLSPFAHWHVLRRLRRTVGDDTLQPGSAHHARCRILRARDLLAWLGQHGTALEHLTQTALEQWLDAGNDHRRHIDDFLDWSRERGLIGDLRLPKRPGQQAPTTFLDDDERIAQLSRCHDPDLPADVAAAGALILLFGLMATRIARLKTSDVIDDGATVFLNINGHRLQLPSRITTLIRRQRDQPRPLDRILTSTEPSPWLFPGQSITQPIHGSRLARRLRDHGITTNAGRNSARLALAAHLPAAVLADLTGTSISSAEAWKNWSKRDWIDYVATRDTHPNTPTIRRPSPDPAPHPGARAEAVE